MNLLKLQDTPLNLRLYDAMKGLGYGLRQRNGVGAEAKAGDANETRAQCFKLIVFLQSIRI